MLTIMATPPSSGEPDDDEVTESQSPISLAAQVNNDIIRYYGN